MTEALQFLAPGLIAYSTVNILARAFYALGDTKTPTRISMTCLVVNLVLTALFLWPLQQAGMGLANSITSFANAGLLLFALRKKLGHLEMGSLRGQLAALAIGGLTAAGTAYGGLQLWQAKLGHATLLLKAGEVFIPAVAAAAAYALVTTLLGVPYARDLIGSIVARFQR